MLYSLVPANISSKLNGSFTLLLHHSKVARLSSLLSIKKISSYVLYVAMRWFSFLDSVDNQKCFSLNPIHWPFTCYQYSYILNLKFSSEVFCFWTCLNFWSQSYTADKYIRQVFASHFYNHIAIFKIKLTYLPIALG